MDGKKSMVQYDVMDTVATNTTVSAPPFTTGPNSFIFTFLPKIRDLLEMILVYNMEDYVHTG